MSDETVRIDDGGLAFPLPCGTARTDIDGYYNKCSGGMSIRDYFAAKAMQSLLGRADSNVVYKGVSGGLMLNAPGSDQYGRQPFRNMAVPMSLVCYEIADAMLAARKAGGK